MWTGRPGQSTNKKEDTGFRHEDSRRTPQRPTASMATRSRRRTVFASAARGRAAGEQLEDKREEEDKRRTREGQDDERRKRRTEVQKEDTGLASAARGQQPAGREEDKTRTQRPDTEFRGGASQRGQLHFS